VTRQRGLMNLWAGLVAFYGQTKQE
jgi:hypothetical protein